MSASDRLATLTATEYRVLRAAIGGTSKTIGQSLGLSPHTVDGHFRQIIRKLGVATRQEAVRMLLDADGAPPQRLSSQTEAIDPAGQTDMLNGLAGRTADSDGEPQTNVVREERAPFGVSPDHANERRNAWMQGGHDRTHIHPLVQAAIAALTLVLVALAIPRLGATFQTLSNLMQPYHH